MWLLLAGGDEGREGCSKLRWQLGAGTEVGVQQEDESLTRGRARGIWACSSRVRWHVTRREWKRLNLCRCARGNTMVIVQENTFVWNTGGLRADLGLVRGGGWDLLDNEARKERPASQRKIEWLRTHVNLSEPTVVFLEEVTGSLGDAKIG